MCTVSLTFSPDKKNEFILTSNRDEAPERKTLPPSEGYHNNTKLFFPKDEVAGGTWIGVSEHKRGICLMNGGFVNHQRQEAYRLSRGVVVKDLLAAPDISAQIKNYNFFGIEPFTIVMVEWDRELSFSELVWDGKLLHNKRLPLKSHIWSSSPLYSSEMKKLRENWFSDFSSSKEISAEGIWNFHHSAGKGDQNTDIIMDRGFIKTKSVTQITKSSEGIKMKYQDLQKNKIYEEIFKPE